MLRWGTAILVVSATIGGAAAAAQSAPAAAVASRLEQARTALLTGAKRPGDLIAEIQGILAIDPDIAEAHLLLGLAYRGVGADMVPESIAEFRQALALAPSLVPARFYLASAYLDLGRPERARDELEAALKLAPGQTQFTTLLSDAERRAGNPSRALALARQIPLTDSSSAQARYYAALALIDLRRRSDAIAELEGLVASGITPPDVTASLGLAYLDESRIDDARRMLETATAAVPTRPDLHVALARAYRMGGRLADAERQLARALPPGATREASGFYEDVEADVHLETGLIRMAQNRLGDAASEFTRSLALRPSHGPTHRYLAEIHLKQNRRDLAREHAEAARQAGESLPTALADLLGPPTGR